VELVQFPFVVTIQGPRFAAVQKNTDICDSNVHWDFCIQADAMVAPKTFFTPPERVTGFSQAWTDVFMYSGIWCQNAAEVAKLIYWSEFLVSGCDSRSAGPVRRDHVCGIKWYQILHSYITVSVFFKDAAWKKWSNRSWASAAEWARRAQSFLYHSSKGFGASLKSAKVENVAIDANVDWNSYITVSESHQ